MKESIEGKILTLMAEEGIKPNQVIVRTKKGKVGIFTRCKKAEAIKPGDIVKGKVVRESENFFFFRPIEVLEKAPENTGFITVMGELQESGRKACALKLRKTPLLESIIGKKVKAVIYLEKDTRR